MPLKFFTIPALDGDRAEAALNDFLRTHVASAVEKHLIQHAAAAYWHVCVTFSAASASTAVERTPIATAPASRKPAGGR
jgi:hypothetical protein